MCHQSLVDWWDLTLRLAVVLAVVLVAFNAAGSSPELRAISIPVSGRIGRPMPCSSRESSPVCD
jgi:hypothetical protein